MDKHIAKRRPEMAKMTLQELRALREQKRKEMKKRDLSDKTMQVVIGMGTCGIAAGAKDTLNAFIQELEEQQVSDVIVTQTGCMGLCYVEPTIEVIVPGMPNIIYGKVDPEVAKNIVRDHLMNKKMVSDHIFDRPAADIIDQGRK